MSEPYYTDPTVTIHAGDCLDVLATLPDASVDAVVTDPPYNLSFMAKPWDAYEGREDAGFAYWLSGLIDGEGHFGIHAHARGTHAPRFQLKLRLDERATLERIRRSLGVGTVSVQNHEPNPMACYHIQDKAGCQRLVDLLDKYPLRAKKQIDYWAWREAVCEWTARPRGNRWHGRADNTRMAGLRDRLMENRAYTDVPWSGHEFQDWCRLWGAECLRILKPGGHALAFGGTRTSHRLTAGLEDAGFEIRDSIAWLYGSGFPKSLDVSKAIDKAAGETGTYGEPKSAAHAEMLARGVARRGEKHPGWDRPWMDDPEAISNAQRKYAPATPDAERWQGWGTALKPAHEPVVVARKPLAGTVAASVLAHGTGALNVDATRIGADRWPSNVVLDESQAAALDEQSGTLTSGANPTRRGVDGDRTAYGEFAGQEDANPQRGANVGGASRFFYTAKAASTERVRVPKVGGDADMFASSIRKRCVKCGRQEVNVGNSACSCPEPDFQPDPKMSGHISHPTVKPLSLMRWLVRLVTPPGGTVLEPFAGSGTTVEACILEGFRCIAIEREADYLPLIRQRIHRRRDPVAAVRATGEDAGLFDLLGGDA